ncbi:MAG: cyclic nucleotide-binding domain-containing protein [Burkholderiaceae bacterium]|nr:cyclic nucleotide-binding domain-containing protein [Burkholderiaceae bacterium]
MDIKKSVLVPHPAESMFDLIEAAENYPLFMPGCRAAEILERTDTIVAARLTLRQAGISIELETRNPKARPTWMEVRLQRGPFRHFLGEWRLTPLNASACRIDFTLSYELEGVAGRIAAPVFARIADNMVDAFVNRAARVPPTMPPPAASAAAAAAPAMGSTADSNASSNASSTASSTATATAPPADSRTDSQRPAHAAAHSAPSTDTPAAAPAPAAPPTLTMMEPAMTDTSLLETLRASKLAAELTEEQSRRLADAMTMRDLKEGEVLVREGSSDSHLYLLVRGVLGVVKNAGSPERVTINTLSAGDFAGELSFMDAQERFASLVALSDARVLGLARDQLEALLDAPSSAPCIRSSTDCRSSSRSCRTTSTSSTGGTEVGRER